MSRFNLNQPFLETDISNITRSGLDQIKNYFFGIFLDDNEHIKSQYLSSLHINDVFIVADEAERLNLSAQEGDFCRQLDDETNWIYADDWVNITGTPLLSLLNDVLITSPVDGEFLRYNFSTSKWENTTMTLDDSTDVIITTPVANQVLQYTGISWVNANVSIDQLDNLVIVTPLDKNVIGYNGGTGRWENLQPNTSWLTDFTITSPQNDEILIFSGGSWINQFPPFTYQTNFSDHANNNTIHRVLGEPTNTYLLQGNGTSFDSVIPSINILYDVTVSAPSIGDKLVWDGVKFVNSPNAEYSIEITGSRALTINDIFKTLWYGGTSDIILTLPDVTVTSIPVLAKLKIYNFLCSARVTLMPYENVLINNKWGSITINEKCELLQIHDDGWITTTYHNENRLYKTITTAPTHGNIIDINYPIEMTANTGNKQISFSYTTNTAQRRYVTYNTSTNLIESDITTSLYAFGSDIININNTDYYSVENQTSSIYMIYSNNRYATASQTLLTATALICSNRILYDSGTGNIVIPYMKTGDLMYILDVSLDLAVINDITCATSQSNVSKMFCGWHLSRGCIVVLNTSQFLLIKLGNNTTSFMDDNTRPTITLQLNEDIEECRNADKTDRFFFLSYTATTYSLWAVADTSDDIYKIITFEQKSEIMRQPSMIRHNILYLLANTNVTTDLYVSQLIRYDITEFDVKRNTNIFEEFGNNSSQIRVSSIFRTLSGINCLGLTYNNNSIAMKYIERAGIMC
jgi:hypothetical protein